MNEEAKKTNETKSTGESTFKNTAAKVAKGVGKAVGAVTFLTGAFVISSVLSLGKDKKDY